MHLYNVSKTSSMLEDSPPFYIIGGYFQQVLSLTAEGGRLRRDTMLVRGKDFELVPEVIWRALSTWYGGNIALPRTVSTVIVLVQYTVFSSCLILKSLSTDLICKKN